MQAILPIVVPSYLDPVDLLQPPTRPPHLTVRPRPRVARGCRGCRGGGRGRGRRGRHECRRRRRNGRRPRRERRGDGDGGGGGGGRRRNGVADGVADGVRLVRLVLLVPRLDELLRRLQILERDALRRPPRLPHQFGVRLPLRLGLVVAHRRHVRP